MLNKTQLIIQSTYIFLFIFMSFGIVGNMQVGVKTPTVNLFMYGIVSFLTFGKIVYWLNKNV